MRARGLRCVWGGPCSVRFDSRAYNSRVKFLAVFFVVAVAPAFVQLVQIGPSDPHYCDRIEKVKPNLVLLSATHLNGSVIDETGAPFKNSLVELRLYESESKQISVKKVRTDEGGHFSLDFVAKGQYRLLASSSRAFRQAQKLECGDRDPCTLLITLQVGPTDQPDSLCPVK
jgi:Carboxypeptidase regulatory-like domain